MTCPIEVGDTFVWTEDYKEVSKGDTTIIDKIRVDEDGVPQLTITDYNNETNRITAEDIQIRVSEGLLSPP